MRASPRLPFSPLTPLRYLGPSELRPSATPSRSRACPARSTSASRTSAQLEWDSPYPFSKPDFARYLRNWLLVYDNWCAVLDELVATQRLEPRVFAPGNNPFSRVFVQRPCGLLEFVPGAGAVNHPVPDF